MLLCADVSQVSANLSSNMKFLCCLCAGIAWGYGSIAGDGSGLGLEEVEVQMVMDITWDAQAKKQCTWWWRFSYAIHMVLCVYGKSVKFGLESRFGKIRVSCMGMLFAWFGRFSMWLVVLVLVGFVTMGSHILDTNRRGVEVRRYRLRGFNPNSWVERGVNTYRCNKVNLFSKVLLIRVFLDPDDQTGMYRAV